MLVQITTLAFNLINMTIKNFPSVMRKECRRDVKSQHESQVWNLSYWRHRHSPKLCHNSAQVRLTWEQSDMIWSVWYNIQQTQYILWIWPMSCPANDSLWVMQHEVREVKFGEVWRSPYYSVKQFLYLHSFSAFCYTMDNKPCLKWWMLYVDVSNGFAFRKQTFLLTLCAAETKSKHPHSFFFFFPSAAHRLNYPFVYCLTTVISELQS